MNFANPAKKAARDNRWSWFLLLIAMVITAATYSTGLSGGYLFDDYPNIIENHGVQPESASIPELVRAVLSSPASEFKRPLASLSFAINYLVTGLDPYWMKLTNLMIHLLNGLLVFLLTRELLQSIGAHTEASSGNGSAANIARISIVAALAAASWMLLPINLTAVLYVVQRMESMANLFVLLGLIGYVAGRRRMLAREEHLLSKQAHGQNWASLRDRNFILCLISIVVPTALGILAKETAVMLPVYALLVEWALFRFYSAPQMAIMAREHPRDRRIVCMFLLVLVLPLIIGLMWILPGILKPESWATRDFTLGTRLLSETRIIVNYIAWTLLPTPHALSFYHDDFHISTGLLSPPSTLASIGLLAALVTLMLWFRSRRPLVALGIALFLSCQLLTGTILPLELIYEHRNYFASFGLVLALIPLLAAPSHSMALISSPFSAHLPYRSTATQTISAIEPTLGSTEIPQDALPLALPRYALLAGLMLCWMGLTAITSYAWGNPLRLAEDLAIRAPQSSRAQYELGRTYIIDSHYDPASPFTKLAYVPLEKAAALPKATILPEQALIFMNARMKLPLKDEWWDSLIAKLKAHDPGVQDESSLAALARCAQDYHCELPPGRMVEAFMAALSHHNPSSRLLATYGDYAWNVLEDHTLGERMTEAAVKASPNEPAYQITLIRMLAVQNRKTEASEALKRLQLLNIGGRLDVNLAELRALPGLQ
jgi:hypothetical protein